jgi:hypothetical protein
MDESVKENTYVRKLHHRISLLTVDSIGHESELHPGTVEKTDDLRKRITEDAGPDITQQAPFFKLPADMCTSNIRQYEGSYCLVLTN